jgi:hypothetical protein
VEVGEWKAARHDAHSEAVIWHRGRKVAKHPFGASFVLVPDSGLPEDTAAAIRGRCRCDACLYRVPGTKTLVLLDVKCTALPKCACRERILHELQQHAVRAGRCCISRLPLESEMDRLLGVAGPFYRDARVAVEVAVVPDTLPSEQSAFGGQAKRVGETESVS